MTAAIFLYATRHFDKITPELRWKTRRKIIKTGDEKMILADKIILERKKNGWSQEELAEKLGVTRQAVSKWEGAQTTPDIQRILEMSKLFGVTVDYLIKDEIEEEEVIATSEENKVGARRVTMEEANEFLKVKKETAPKIAFGVFLCIISPIIMFILAVGAEEGYLSMSEDAAGGIGMILLLFIVGIACSIFISCGARTKKFQYLEENVIDTEYGVTGMVKERMAQYNPIYTRNNILGLAACFGGAMVLFSAAVIDANDFISVILFCITLFIVALGVNLFVIAGINNASFEKLLQEGEYTVENKTSTSIVGMVSTIYWTIVTAIFLTMGFFGIAWKVCGLIWPIAGVLFAAVVAVVQIFEKNRSS